MYLLFIWGGRNDFVATFLGPKATGFALVISGAKKSRFSGPTPSYGPSNGFGRFIVYCIFRPANPPLLPALRSIQNNIKINSDM